MPIRINPSILAADFANLERDLNRIRSADMVHVDVMDNHFVPNLTFGLPMVTRLAEVSPIPLDVHLMIDDPERWAEGYARAGAASVTFSAEATEHPVDVARGLRAAGVRAGIALKPGTAADPYLDQLAEYDMVLVMTVEPGFGGQSFRADMMPKLARLAAAVREAGTATWLQVDGGITEETIVTARNAGADTFVAGSSVYSGPDPDARIAALRRAIRDL
ncbi:MAG: ribulose-phosphate 3-epimerase [Microbacteriaceae bacterium]|jgi:ribulose-phosphate 3-epimerase